MRVQTSREELSAKLDRLLTMLKTDSGNASLRRHCTDIAASLGEFDIVTDLAESALSMNAADAAAHFDLATGLIGKRDYRAALDMLRKLEQMMGDDVAMQMNVALCHYCLGEFTEARPALEFCYRAGSRDPGLLRLIVSTHHHLGELEEAMRVAADNVEAVAADGALAGVCALLYLDAGDAAQAARWATTALNLIPTSIDGRVVQATLLTSRMELDDARRVLEGVLVDAPGTGRAWVGLGALSMLGRDLDGAKQQISRGLELMPGHVGSWHILAWAQLLSGDLTGAESTFQTAVTRDRNFAEGHGGLAVVAAMRGETIRARHLIQIASKLDAQCLSARFAEAVLAGNADPTRSQLIIRDTVAGLTARDSSALSAMLTRLTRH